MYKSFTGQSRRPRQVNLSGRPTNPFQKPNAGAQQAVASAHQDRANRQLQRERQQAAAHFQRVWRGQRARRRTFASWRQIWDAQEQTANGPYHTREESLQQLRRLMLFFNPAEDVKRLAWYGTRHITTNSALKEASPASQESPKVHAQWSAAYAKLQKACTSALRVLSDSSDARTLLGILAYSASQSTFSSEEAKVFYETLTNLPNLPKEPLQAALLAPLRQSVEAYDGLVILLTSPLKSDMLRLLSSTVDPDLISDATDRISRNNSQMSTRERLWLLGNLIYLAKRASSMSFTAAVAHLLGSLADDVEFERRPEDVPNDVFDTEFLRAADAGFPLNTFLHQEITSLLDEHAVRNLLAGKGSSVTDATEEGLPRANAHALARYALTLLRCFPRRSDDLRMWLHLGPTNVDTISPTRYLWDASKQSQIFSDIWSTSRGVVQILKERTPATSRTEDWTIILVFLEMFSFDLKIMDDEEFMGNSPVRKRNSAVPVGDVGRLVTFLKHLGFTLYHDAAELNDMSSIPAQQTAAVTLQSRFRANATTVPDVSKPLTIADLPGLTTDYLKGLVTALLRAIYERDSRRGFLPKGHWLMTDRFDMRNFIGDVVHEEERRRQIHEDEDNEDDDVDDDDDDDEPDDLRNENSRSTASGHVRVLRAQQARARAQVKASKRRYMESVAPKLEILQNMPFIIPFNTRVETFRQFVHLDQVKRREGQVDPDQWRGMMLYPGNHARTVIARDLARHHAKIKRTQEFLDAYEQFYDLGADLKEPIQITFVDQWDMPEAGIDGGGVTKEFLTSVISQAFDQKVENTERFFIENDQHLLFPNPTAFDDLQVRYEQMGHDKDSSQIREAKRELYKQYEFLGRIIGKCLYEGILIDVSFAGFFLKKWALTGGAGSAPSESHYRPNLNDLLELDEGLYRGLLQVKNAADASELGMTFSVNDAIGPPGSQRIVEIDLIPNGSNIAVTNENRISYINRIASWRLQVQSQKQTRAFLRGLADMIPPSWLHMFNQSELQTLIGGAAAGIDVDDLRRNTHYGGTYVIGTDGLEHPSVRMFWDVMRKFPEDDRRKVLKFVTSTPRGPLLGFSHLHPKFSIRDSGRDANRYPTTSTCVNLLKLPMYESEDVLREKLLAAVNSGAGFDLS